MRKILIYGGSFDPIHYGHLNTATAVQNHLHFDQVIFVPCKTPVLKEQTKASAKQRVAMLKLALKSYPDFALDCREVDRDTPSYMVETLNSFRKELGDECSITLLLGMDSYLQLPQWHNWQELLKLSNLLIIHRAGTKDKPAPEQSLIQYQTENPDDLIKHPHGKIYHYNAGEFLIASTQIRELIKEGKATDKLIPSVVAEYIREERLYLK